VGILCFSAVSATGVGETRFFLPFGLSGWVITATTFTFLSLISASRISPEKFGVPK